MGFVGMIRCCSAIYEFLGLIMDKTTFRPTAFVVVSTNHGSMLVNRHDYRLVSGGGYGVGYQLLNTSSFDQNEVDVVLHLLYARREVHGDGVVAVDCGANIGVHTIEWAKFMHAWGSVIAIEAQERIFYALAGNITLNNCFNARAIWGAVGAENGTINVPQPNYFVPSSFGSLEIRDGANCENIGQVIDRSSGSAQKTNLIKLDDLGLERLDFLKIDIEGMELEALNGARSVIEKFRPCMLIEKIKTDESALRNFLAERGYEVFSAGINLIAVHGADPVVKQISP
jgi:FkbM family methyltransferase